MNNIVTRAELDALMANADTKSIIAYVEKAFTAYSAGAAVVPPVGILTFEAPPGDVHIKYGYLKNDDIYVIKIASGFYNNPQIGLPAGNGCILVFNQKNGLLETILMDECMLTDIRTAVAGAVVAKYFAPEAVHKIGIFGTGVQARLQLKYLKDVLACRKVLVCGRDAEKLQKYKSEMEPLGFSIETTQDNHKVSKECNYIVMTTAAKSPVLFADGLQPGTHITAMGADMREKQELDFEVIKQADLIVADSISQCVDHGEIHKAISAGVLAVEKIQELGHLISNVDFNKKKSDISIVDLTGIATQDVMIARFVLDHLKT